MQSLNQPAPYIVVQESLKKTNFSFHYSAPTCS